MLSGEGNAVRVTILVRELGGVVCAAMEYSVPGPVAQRHPKQAFWKYPLDDILAVRLERSRCFSQRGEKRARLC